MREDSIASDTSLTSKSNLLTDDATKKNSKNSACSQFRCFTYRLSRRYQLAWLMAIGLTIMIGMRCTLGLSMLKINTIGSLTGSANTPLNATTVTPETAKMRWSNVLVGSLEAAFFAGLVLAALPAGLLSMHFAVHRLFAAAVITTCLLNCLVPVFVLLPIHPMVSFSILFFLRVTQGLAEGFFNPGLHMIIALWSPKQDRSRLMTISHIGHALGPIIGYPAIGNLIDRFGWPAGFYTFAALGLAWSLVWICCFPNRPEDDIWISPEELQLIQDDAPSSNQNIDKSSCFSSITNVPWCSMLTSLPVWALILGTFTRNWIFQFSFTGLPQYLRDINKIQSDGNVLSGNVDVNKNSETNIGLHMLGAYLAMALFTPLGGILADWLIMTHRLTVGGTRKVIYIMSYSMVTVCLIVLCFFANIWLSTFMLVVSLGGVGFSTASYAVNCLDIAPRLAGILTGLSAGLGTFAGITSPIAAAKLTVGRTLTEWQHFFLLSIGVQLIGLLMFGLFSSGEEQSWAKNSEDKKTSIIKVPSLGSNISENDISTESQAGGATRRRLSEKN